MHDYVDYPPQAYLEIILQNCPDAAMIYVYLWQMSDELNQVVIEKKDIRNTFLISPTVFRRHLCSIVCEGLSEVDDCPNLYIVRLLEYDSNMDEIK